jgi:hypothetical protein
VQPANKQKIKNLSSFFSRKNPSDIASRDHSLITQICFLAINCPQTLLCRTPAQAVPQVAKLKTQKYPKNSAAEKR